MGRYDKAFAGGHRLSCAGPPICTRVGQFVATEHRMADRKTRPGQQDHGRVSGSER